MNARTPGDDAYYTGSDKPVRGDAEYVAFMLHNARDHVGYWTECDQPPCVMARAVAGQHAEMVASTSCGVDLEQCEANARLIAAAPELLAALVQAVTSFAAVEETWTAPAADRGAHLPSFRAALARANAAIAKARGK